MPPDRVSLFSRCRATSALLMAVAAVVVLPQVPGCTDTHRGIIKPNQPPHVWLSSGPPEGTTAVYTVSLYWGGWDPDGEIAYYEYAITNNSDGPFCPEDTTGREKWNKVYGNDSTFLFSADQLASTRPNNMVTEFTRSHTFFIRAVDREGLASVEPAYRSFTARTLSPKVNVTIPRRTGTAPAFVPPITTFRWNAQDYIDDLTNKIDPDSVSWILEATWPHNRSYEETIEYIRKLPVDSPEWDKWGGWKWYKAPRDSGRFWTTPPLEFEPYVFAIRAMDEAGAITPVFDEAYNVRRVQVSQRTTGPVFTVKNEYLGLVTTAICHEPVTILDLPAGIPIGFSWEASAEHYGGTVTGYRYGWDIDDLTDPDGWEVDYTPFTATTARSPDRTFFFGTHTFTVEVVDNSGYCSRVEIKVNVIQFSMENNLYFIDDFNEGSQVGWDDIVAPGLTPNDEQHDAFWLDMLSDVAGFNATSDMLDVKLCDVVPLTDLARYKCLIWSVNGVVKTFKGTVLHEYIRFRPPEAGQAAGGKRYPNVLALFLAAGGHLLICGNQPISLVINPDISIMEYRFPLIFLYELTGNQRVQPNVNTVRTGKDSFAYRELCLETVDFAYVDNFRRRGPGFYCPTHSFRIIPPGSLRNHTMRGAIPADPKFPRLDLRPEAAGAYREYREDHKGLDVELYNTQYFLDACSTVPRKPRNCFEPLYLIDCLDNTECTYAQPVAFWTSTYADRVADAPGAIAARSAVFGFPPVFFNPDQTRQALEVILFDEWQLPRK